MDLHPKNIMIFKDKNKFGAKILDLGLSCNSYNKEHLLKASSVNIKWLPRELIVDENVNQSNDVWSLGCILFYILSWGGEPWNLGNKLNIASHLV
jgi:serine/threonine protein kinase